MEFLRQAGNIIRYDASSRLYEAFSPWGSAASRVTQQSHDNHMIGTYQQLLSMCWGAIWKSWGRLWRRWKSLLYSLFDWYSWQLGLSPDNLIWPATADFSPFYSVRYRDLLIPLLLCSYQYHYWFCLLYFFDQTSVYYFFAACFCASKRGVGYFQKLWYFTRKYAHLTCSYIYVYMQWFCNASFVMCLLMQYKQQVVSAFICYSILLYSAASLVLLTQHNCMYYSINRYIISREKHPLQQFHLKRGMGLFLQ